jgi:hypothetical protein
VRPYEALCSNFLLATLARVEGKGASGPRPGRLIRKRELAEEKPRTVTGTVTDPLVGSVHEGLVMSYLSCLCAVVIFTSQSSGRCSIANPQMAR